MAMRYRPLVRRRWTAVRRRNFYRRKKKAPVRGNRARSRAFQFKRRIRRYLPRKKFVGYHTSTQRVINTYNIDAKRVLAADVWTAGTKGPTPGIFNVIDPLTVEAKNTSPLLNVYKQYRVKEIITYVRFIDAPSTLSWFSAVPITATTLQAYLPIHWELFYKAQNLNDAAIFDDYYRDPAKVGITNSGRAYKFVVRPKVSFTLNESKPNDQTVAGSVKQYKGASWINSDETADVAYKVADVMNHSYFDLNDIASTASYRAEIQLDHTIVYEWRFRKSMDMIDTTGAQDAVAVGSGRLYASKTQVPVQFTTADPAGLA